MSGNEPGRGLESTTFSPTSTPFKLQMILLTFQTWLSTTCSSRLRLQAAALGRRMTSPSFVLSTCTWRLGMLFKEKAATVAWSLWPAKSRKAVSRWIWMGSITIVDCSWRALVREIQTCWTIGTWWTCSKMARPNLQLPPPPSNTTIKTRSPGTIDTLNYQSSHSRSKSWWSTSSSNRNT